MYLWNCWYVAAWARELDEGLLARTLLGEPVVLYRDGAGAPVALEDSCAHRYMPLSMGALVEGGLQCAYHGLVYDRTGACVHVPGQTEVPPGARVRSYPVVEKWRWIWIWMGDPAAADEKVVPDYHWNDDPGWVSVGDYFHVGGGYRLLVENLLDLSHVAYVHASTLGTEDVADYPVRVRLEDRAVHVDRWMMGTQPPPMFQAVRNFPGQVDRWQLITYMPPSHFVIDVGCADASTGAPQGDRRCGVTMFSNHTVTPETATSCHYFWHHARNFRLDEDGLTQTLAEATRNAFGEDVGIIEAQQRRMDAIRPRKPIVDINADAGVLAARHLLESLITREREDTAAAVTEPRR